MNPEIMGERRSPQEVLMDYKKSLSIVDLSMVHVDSEEKDMLRHDLTDVQTNIELAIQNPEAVTEKLLQDISLEVDEIMTRLLRAVENDPEALKK